MCVYHLLTIGFRCSLFSKFQGEKKDVFFLSGPGMTEIFLFVLIKQCRCTNAQVKKSTASQSVVELATSKQNIVKEILVTVNRVDHCGLTKCKSVSFISWIICQTYHTCGYCEVKKRSIVKSQIQSSSCYDSLFLYFCNLTELFL